MHGSSMDLCRIFRDEYLDFSTSLRIADVGSYNVNGCYRSLFANDLWEYVGFDAVVGPNVDFVFPTDQVHHGQFDVVISGQTLEHVAKPWRWIFEVVALLKPGGLVWIVAPNTFQFHGELHYLDCWRIWPDGLSAIFDEAGLEQIYSRRVGVDTFGLARKAVK